MIKNAFYDSKSLFLLILAAIFGFSGFALATPGDMDGDGYVNLADLYLFTIQWLADDCASFNWCEGADINHNGNVDFNDFASFAQNWSPATPIWSDEFDGTSLDTSKWNIIDKLDWSKLGQSCWYAPKNVEVSGGTLKIHSYEESYNGCQWTGACLESKYHPQYKYLVAKVRHSAPNTYIWATWWTVGWQSGTWKWPPEFDIMEFCTTYGTMSPSQTSWWGTSSSPVHDSRVTGVDESQWHTYGAYWSDTHSVFFYVDGVVSATPSTPIDQDAMAMLMKLSSSPNRDLHPDGCALADMEVDYVRVYDAPPAQPAPTPHLALNKPATASSSINSAETADKAVDGLPTSRWESNWSDPQWLCVDLQATYSITQVKLYWQYACARDYKIQVADSPSGPWTDCISITGRPASEGWITHSFSAQTGRYIRVNCTARATAYGYSLYEMQVY